MQQRQPSQSAAIQKPHSQVSAGRLLSIPHTSRRLARVRLPRQCHVRKGKSRLLFPFVTKIRDSHKHTTYTNTLRRPN